MPYRGKRSGVEENANFSHSSKAPSIHDDDDVPTPGGLEEESWRGDRGSPRNTSPSNRGSTDFKSKRRQQSPTFSEPSFKRGPPQKSRPYDRNASLLQGLVDSLYDAFQHPKIDDLCSFLEEEQIKSRIRDSKGRKFEIGPDDNLRVPNEMELFGELNEVAKPFLETLTVRMEAGEAEIMDDAFSQAQKAQKNYNTLSEPPLSHSVPSVDIEQSATPSLLSSSRLFAMLFGQEESGYSAHTVHRPDPSSKLHPTESARVRASRTFRISHNIRRWFAFGTLRRNADKTIDAQTTIPLGNDIEGHLIDGAKQESRKKVRNYAIELDVRGQGEAFSPRLFDLKACEHKGAGFRASCCTNSKASQPVNQGIVNESCMRQYLSQAEQLKASGGLRYIYVEDDLNSFSEVMQRYNLLTRHFGYDFSKWALGILNYKDSQTEKRTFTLPPFRNFRRTFEHSAFGWDYPVPSDTQVNQTNPLNPRHAAESPIISSKLESTSFIYRRCSIYIRQRTEDPLDEEALDKRSNVSPKASMASNMLMDTTVIAVDFGSEPSKKPSLFPSPRKIQKLECCEESTLYGDSPNIIGSIMEKTLDTLLESWATFIAAKSKAVRELQELIIQQPASADFEMLLWHLSQEVTRALSHLEGHRYLFPVIERKFSKEDYLRSDDEFDMMKDIIGSQLKRPIEDMIDLMYKSISIRDARRSLQLNTSLWRLSWITFIFLPLTWLCGFFGMNVATFKSNPSIVWYFIAAVPLMCVVFLAWLTTKRLLVPAADESQRPSKTKAKLS